MLTFHHGLSDDQLSTVARILLNWGAVDLFAGEALAEFYDIADFTAKADLIDPVDLRKKLDLLDRKARTQDDTELASVVRDLKRCHTDWGEDRNRLAHGSGKFGIDGVVIISAKKGATIRLADLPLHEARSDYILSLAVKVRLIQIGQRETLRSSSWPQKPPPQDR